MKPDFGEPTQVFDLFEGKNFELIITRQNDYNNYDKSKFSSTTSAIVLGDKAAERNETDMGTIKTELETAPSLKSFEYQAWDEPTREFVNSVIKMYLNPGQAVDTLTTPSLENNTTSTASKTKKEPATATKTAAAAPAAQESNDDLESFLNDLEI